METMARAGDYRPRVPEIDGGRFSVKASARRMVVEAHVSRTGTTRLRACSLIATIGPRTGDETV